MKGKEWVGKRFGKLTITKIHDENQENSYAVCTCLCDCGTHIDRKLKLLIYGNTKSCGCGWNKSKNINPKAFVEKDPDSFYWAGFLAADGCINRKGGCRIELQIGDYGHLEKFKKWLNIYNEIGYTNPGSQHVKSLNKTIHSNGSAYIHFTNVDTVKNLAEYGITPRKSLTYAPPEFCLNSPDFWRGMIDGDGHIGKKTSRIYLCRTEATCIGFRDFVSTFYDSKTEIRKESSIYRIVYYGECATEIIKTLYGNSPNFYLDRKFKLASKICGLDIAINQ